MMFGNVGALVFGRAGTWLAGGLFLASALGVATLWLGRDTAIRQRDHAETWAQNACAAVGSLYKETDPKGHLLPRARWGRSCLGAIQGLAAQAATAASEALHATQEHEASQDAKRAADRSAVNRNAVRRTAVKREMEKVDAAVEADRVTGPWWSSYNRLLGVPDPTEGGGLDASGPGRRDVEGDAVAGSPAVRPEAGGLQSDVGGDHASGSAVAVRSAGRIVPSEQRDPRPSGELVVARLVR